MVHRMRVSDLRQELVQRGLEAASTTIKNRAELVSLLLETLSPDHRTSGVKTRLPQNHVGPLVDATPVANKKAPVSNRSLPLIRQAVVESTTQDTLLEGTLLEGKEPVVAGSLDDSACMRSIQIDPTKRYILKLKGISDNGANGTGVGLVLVDEKDDCIVWYASKHYPTSRSLYEAEYTALVLALRFGLRRFGLRDLRVQSEQSVIVNQLDGVFKVEKASLQQLYTKVDELRAEADSICSLKFQHILKSRNYDSTELATKALETRVSVNLGDEEGMNDDDDVPYDRSLHAIDPMEESFASINLDNTVIPPSSTAPVDTTTSSIDPTATYRLQFDGGSRGNPGVSGAGVVIYSEDGQEIWCGWKFLSTAMSNNQAEYRALQLGLECARSLGIERIIVEGDSELVIKQITGVYKVKNDALRQIWQQIRAEVQEFKYCHFQHIFRESNKRADCLANNAMDQKSSYGFVEEPQ